MSIAVAIRRVMFFFFRTASVSRALKIMSGRDARGPEDHER